MKKIKLVYTALCVVVCSLLLTGCSFTEAWFKTPYLNGEVSEDEAVADINDYITKDVKNGDRLLFKKVSTDPKTLSKAYTNDAGLILGFESDSGKNIHTIIISFDNTDQNKIKDAETITRIICEMSAPMDYFLGAGTKLMLNAMHIEKTDFEVYSRSNSWSETVVEKKALNEALESTGLYTYGSVFGPHITLIRLRHNDYQDLQAYCQDHFKFYGYYKWR